MTTNAVGGRPPVLLLRSSELLARLDPCHGGELLDLIDLGSGRQLLGRPPFRAGDPLQGELTEEDWTMQYRGGWQLTVPNVCNACTVDGDNHGFHGSGSVGSWDVLEHDAGFALLEWEGHGIRVTRGFAVAGAELRIETEARGLTGAAPMIALEHCTLGLDTLDPQVTLRLPRAKAYEVSDEYGPTHPPRDTPRWPHVLLLDGALERADSWPITRRRSRWIVLHDVPEGSAEIVNTRHRTGLALRWDVEALPHLHVWHEAGGAQRFWNGGAYILGIEPTNVPHGLGLAEAVKAGQAFWVQPNNPLGWWVTARILK